MSIAIDINVEEKRYSAQGAHAAVTALRDVRVRVLPSALCALVGPSGCGKSTLLNIIAGLDRDFSGTIVFDGTSGPSPRIGYVFQSPRLLPWRTVRENIALVMQRDQTGAELECLLGAVELSEVADVYPNRLSGGMARRAALARALAIAPEVLLLDEPFLSLDVAAADRLRSLLIRLVSERPATVLLVTHNPGEAVELADQILFLSPAPGHVVAEMSVTPPREQRHTPSVLANLHAEAARLGRRALGPSCS